MKGRTVIADNSYLVKVEVGLGEFFGGDVAVELREMGMKALLRFKTAAAASSEAAAAAFLEELPAIILDHGFYKPKGQEEVKLTSAEVVALIESKTAALLKIVQEYSAVVFPQAKKSGDSSAGSQTESSGEA